MSEQIPEWDIELPTHSRVEQSNCAECKSKPGLGHTRGKDQPDPRSQVIDCGCNRRQKDQAPIEPQQTEHVLLQISDDPESAFSPAQLHKRGSADTVLGKPMLLY